MASVLVFMDRQGEHLSQRSRQVLGAGRRIASHLGATLYGVAPESDGDNDTWISETGLGGADKVVLLSGSFASESVRPQSLHAGLAAVVDALRPNLVLMAESASSRALAPQVAAQLEAVFLSGVTVDCESDGSLTLREWSCGRQLHRCVAASELAVPVVATLSTAFLSEAKGEDDADVIFFKAPNSAEDSGAVLGTENGLDSLASAGVVVCAGMGAASCLPLVDELSRAMGAVRCATKTLWQEGLAEREDVVDWGLQRISPKLYIICGASGSASHLSAVAAGTRIITLGRDPLSPAIRAASYGLLGELETNLPVLTQHVDALIAAGGRR